jgi:hypothetical protein
MGSVSRAIPVNHISISYASDSQNVIRRPLGVREI